MSMEHCPTVHNEAKYGDIAKTVLMPGDPLRAKFIAESFLEDAKQVNNVRGMLAYTGRYGGAPVTVMASGMGMPSMGIYSWELYNFYDVKNILRIGSAGSINEEVKVRDVVIGMGACTNSAYATQYHLPGSFAPIASYVMLSECVKAAQAERARYHVGSLLSSDTFYSADDTATDKWRSMGVMAIEMEAAALYMNAARCGKNALAICTISDHILTGEATTSQERQTSFTQMMKIALDTAASLNSLT